MSARAYFDWNATAPLRPEAREAMVAAFGETGNAGSIHAEGRAARRAVEAARAQVAALVGTHARNVIFTAGATEANMLALQPGLETEGDRQPRSQLLISAIEHPSVRSGGRFAPAAIQELPVTGAGVVDLDALGTALSRTERPLVSVMAANNETGVIQPTRQIADLVHAANGIFHVDAAQAAGRIACSMEALGADLLSLSAHKFGGPQGTGALVVSDRVRIGEALVKGGGQERGLRAGTENVAGIAGLGAAAAAAQASRQADGVRMARLRDRFEAGLKASSPDVAIFGTQAPRLPNTCLFTVPGLKAETAVIAFDLAGVAVSSGSACSSGRVQASHVLTSMGVDAGQARGAIRVSLGWTTTEADIDRLLAAWIGVGSSLLKQHAA